MPEAQAYALVRLVADVRQPGFDREIAHQDLVTVGFTSERADKLIKKPCSARRGRRRGRGNAGEAAVMGEGHYGVELRELTHENSGTSGLRSVSCG